MIRRLDLSTGGGWRPPLRIAFCLLAALGIGLGIVLAQPGDDAPFDVAVDDFQTADWRLDRSGHRACPRPDSTAGKNSDAAPVGDELSELLRVQLRADDMHVGYELSELLRVQLPADAAQSDDAPAKEPDPQPEPGVDGVVPWPKLAEMTLPTAAELLQGPRRTWIVLKTDEVIVCEPIFSRPETLEKMQAKIDAYPSFKGARTPEALAEYRKVFDDLHYLYIILPEEGEPEYRLHMRYIAEIRHHEDLVLRRVDVLIDEGRYRDAFEMLFVLERSRSNWPGYTKRRERLLFLEAAKKLADDKPEIALVALEELYANNTRYEGLKNKLGEVTDRLIADAAAEGDYRRSRHFLLRLKSREPEHSVVASWTGKLLGEATASIERSQQFHAAGDFAAAVDAAELAARIWPNMPGEANAPNLIPVYDRAHNRYPRLRVGVVQLPQASSGGFPPSAADARRSFLTQSTLFEVAHSDDSPHFRSRFFEQWEPTDLGRRVRFTLRPNRIGWESQQVVTASTIMSSLEARLDPFHALYDERLAGYVAAATVISPFEFELQFRRVPARIESLLTFPATRTEFVPRGENDRRLKETTWLASSRFTLTQPDGELAVYRRAVAEPAESNLFHVAEVAERLYPDYEKAVQGLLRGEVSMLPRVRSRDVPLLESDDRFQMVEMALPVTHLVQFNPRSRATGNRELRRALAFALHREKILQETVLEDPGAARGRVVTGPFATRGLSSINRGVRGYAYNTQVKPRRYDPSLAASLYLAAGKEFDGEVPELRLACEDDPVARAAAMELVKQWGAAGVRVKLLSAEECPPSAASEEWDIVYRIVRLTDPAQQLWPMLTFEPTARVEALAFLPDWLRQELIELDRVGDWKSAVGRLQQLHAHLQAEAMLLPLWEVDDFVVFRQTIRGYPTPLLHPYQDLERWTVKPWLPSDLP